MYLSKQLPRIATHSPLLLRRIRCAPPEGSLSGCSLARLLDGSAGSSACCLAYGLNAGAFVCAAPNKPTLFVQRSKTRPRLRLRLSRSAQLWIQLQIHARVCMCACAAKDTRSSKNINDNIIKSCQVFSKSEHATARYPIHRVSNTNRNF